MKYIRKCFENLKPYYSKHIDEGIILNANESPFDIPNELKEYMKGWIDGNQFNRYPDIANRKLVNSIAARYNLLPENVTCGVGSDEMLECLFQATIDAGGYVLSPNPSFSMYTQFNSLNLGNTIYAQLNSDFTYNIDNYLNLIKEYDPKLIFICNPNNPTGSLMTREDIIKIINATNNLVVVDEAYEEFSNTTVIDLVNTYDNLMVLKTFSKAFSLANVRCGYAISKKENIELINVVRPPYNLNAFSMEICNWAIGNYHLYNNNIKIIIGERKRVYKALNDLHIEIYPSSANFLWMRLADNALEKLLENKIYIRKVNYNNILYSRVTIGTKAENDKLIEIIKAYS